MFGEGKKGEQGNSCVKQNNILKHIRNHTKARKQLSDALASRDCGVGVNDTNAMKRTEVEAIGALAADAEAGNLDTALGAVVYYLSSAATQQERTHFLQLMSNMTAQPGRMQLEHQVLMLSKREQGRNDVSSSGSSLLRAPYPFFHAPPGSETTVSHLNRAIERLTPAVVAGGGGQTFWGPDSCPGFNEVSPFGLFRREVTAAGTLPHVQSPDGTMMTDTVGLESHLNLVHGQLKEVLDQLHRDVAALKTSVGGHDGQVENLALKCKKMKATITKAAKNLTTYVGESVDALYQHHKIT